MKMKTHLCSHATGRMAWTLGCLLGLASASGAQSQDIVSPGVYGLTEANGAVFWALSPFTARRQLIVEESQLRAGKGLMLQSIAVRRNGGDLEAYAQGQVLVDVWVSHTTRTAKSLSPIFSENRGKDFVKLHSGVVALPGTGKLKKAPATWKSPHVVEIRLRSRFFYKGGSLLIETLTRPIARKSKVPTPSAWWPIDGVTSAASGQVRLLGKSCISGMDAQPASADPASLVIGGAAHWYLRGRTQSKVALFALGFDAKAFGPYRLPLDLGSLGAKGCRLYNDWVHLQATPIWTGPEARAQLAQVDLALPNQKVFVGRSLFGQWILPDLRANALGLSFSNGVQGTLAAQPASPGVGWLEAASSTATSGELLPGRAPVLRFSFRKR